MTTMVQFQSRGALYCIPVEATRAVRSAAGIIPMPDPNDDVAGLLPGDPPITVVSPFGSAGQHVLVLQVGVLMCGLLVDAVTGLCRVDDAAIMAAPVGQRRGLVSGSLNIDGDLVLVADPMALAVAV